MEGIQYIGGYLQYMQRDNISTVEGIQYNGGKFFISACLAIKNNEKVSIFLYYERNLHSEVSKI